MLVQAGSGRRLARDERRVSRLLVDDGRVGAEKGRPARVVDDDRRPGAVIGAEAGEEVAAVELDEGVAAVETDVRELLRLATWHSSVK